MAKKNESGYLSAKESRRISRENRKITDQFEKLHKRKNVPEEEFLTQMHDPVRYRHPAGRSAGKAGRGREGLLLHLPLLW